MGSSLLQSEHTGFMRHCPALLALTWPLATDSDDDEPEEEAFHSAAEFLLAKCMPANGEPMWNLNSIIIRSETIMRGCIPAKPPALEELVLMAPDRLELSSEDPLGTSSALKTFCAFVHPLVTSGHDMLVMSGNPMGRGLTLGAAAAMDESGRSPSGSSGVYLRPIDDITARGLSLQQLYTMALQLVGCESRGYCRCGACVTCLTRLAALTSTRGDQERT